MENEEWRNIEGYEGQYQVSNLGRVKSVKFGKEKIMKPAVNKFGYLYVVLCKDGNVKTLKIHRLVAQEFIPNPSNLEQVNHKDEVKTNNCACNLEWCTASYNNNYGTRNERSASSLSKKVQMYDLNMNFISEFPSTHEVTRQLGFSQSNISKVCNGKLKQTHGYIFRYA